MEYLIGGFVGAVFSVILSIIFMPMLEGEVTDFLVSKLSSPFGLRKKEALSGEWIQDWQVDGADKSVVHADQKLVLQQLGRSLVGQFTFDGRTYRIRAKIENNIYINGMWFDEISGQVYHGTFQARIEVNQRNINGKWIGFSRSHNRINTGDWKWSRRA